MCSSMRRCPGPSPARVGIRQGGISAWPQLAGVATAFFLYILRPDLPGVVRTRLAPLVNILERKYGFDELYAWLFAGGARLLGRGFWKTGDQTLIDGVMVNGSARVVGWFASVVRLLQTGLLNQYAVTMLFGVMILAFWFLRR